MLWFAWKFVPLWYQQQRLNIASMVSCVVICLKIRTFVVSATTISTSMMDGALLWFAWKFVPLWYQQQLDTERVAVRIVVICLKIRTFVVSATTNDGETSVNNGLWLAWKLVPLWYQQQQLYTVFLYFISCDLLENSYLCGISNNYRCRPTGYL